MKTVLCILTAIFAFAITAHGATTPASADSCKGLPTHEDLKKALTDARKQNNGGFNQDMWGAIVDRSGVVCAVAYTGTKVDDQWPGSRLIAAEKAFTANSFSLPASALSTANLYSGVQPGGFLYGLAASAPANAAVAYKGDGDTYGTAQDPMVGQRLGGIITFGGGLALYNKEGHIVGALGVSGDSSCGDHNIAWRTRHALNDDYVPMGMAKDKSDQIIYDIHLGHSASGFGHAACAKDEAKVVKDLPPVRKMTKE